MDLIIFLPMLLSETAHFPLQNRSPAHLRGEPEAERVLMICYQHYCPNKTTAALARPTAPGDRRRLRRLAPLLLLLPLFLLPALAAAGEQETERKLLEDFAAGGHVALIRHALAPGFGDPATFRIDDCATQRNLSDEGRAQAARIGMKLRQAGIAEADVYTSQWCRCRETAALLSFGPPADLPPLNSFFRDFGRREQQTEALRAWLKTQPLEKPLILVTHQVNITAFSGVSPGSGEMVLMRRTDDNRLSVAGSIRTN